MEANSKRHVTATEAERPGAARRSGRVALKRTGRSFYRWLDVLSGVINAGMLLVASDGRLEYANDTAVDLLGCDSKDAVGRRWEELSRVLKITSEDVAADLRPKRFIADVPVSDGTRLLRVEKHTLNEPDCQGCLVLMRDRLAGDAMETDLLLASRMRSLVHVYRVLAHDLKTPLNAMQLTLELLADPAPYDKAPDGKARRQRHLEVLREELSRLDRILQTMLEQKEPTEALKQLVDLREVLREIVALLAPQARSQRVELAIEVSDSPLCIHGYRDRIKQALLNLAINALEAMPGGGRLAIALEASGGTGSVRISDTGPGLPDEVVDGIGQIHFTTKSSDTRIGLYVARLVVESHGGEIVVQSAETGTVFTVRFPLRNETAASVGVAAGGYT